jgi:hypothetical protein
MEKAVEGHRSPRRWRDYSGGATGAKRLGVRQSAGAFKMRRKENFPLGRGGGRGYVATAMKTSGAKSSVHFD